MCGGKTRVWTRPHVNLWGCPRLERGQLIRSTDAVYSWAEHFSPRSVPQGKKWYLQRKEFASGLWFFSSAFISFLPKSVTGHWRPHLGLYLWLAGNIYVKVHWSGLACKIRFSLDLGSVISSVDPVCFVTKSFSPSGNIRFCLVFKVSQLGCHVNSSTSQEVNAGEEQKAGDEVMISNKQSL